MYLMAYSSMYDDYIYMLQTYSYNSYKYLFKTHKTLKFLINYKLRDKINMSTRYASILSIHVMMIFKYIINILFSSLDTSWKCI